MATSEKPLNTSDKKKRKNWRLSFSVGDVSRDVSVRELTKGGFIVSTSEYGKNKKGDWYDKNEEYYSENNPLEGKVTPDDEATDIEEIFDKTKKFFE